MNKWIGSDKPKKDDFNSDNQKIDEVFGLLAQSIEQLESTQGDGSYASEQALATHTDNSEIHVTAEEKAAWSTGTGSSGDSSGHATDKVVHITAQERSIWTYSSGFIMGYYDGNGESTKFINLAYKPKFGIIFAVDTSIVGFSPAASQVQINTGIMCTHGCSRGIELASGGFVVTHSTMGGIDNSSLRFNTNGVRYVYFIWKPL